MFQRKLVEMFLKLRLVPCENLDIDLAFGLNSIVTSTREMFLKLPIVRFKYIIPNILFLTVIQHILEKRSSDISVSRFDLMLVF